MIFTSTRMSSLQILLGICLFTPACTEETTIVQKEDKEKLAQNGNTYSQVTRLFDKAEKLEHLNIFITLNESGALERAIQLDNMAESAGVLHGIPIVVKDNIHVSGLPNTAGTPGLKEFIPTEDNPAVACLKAAGAIVVGKTNMHELAAGITSNNTHFGAVGNAVDATRFAGGSSGGTASAIAAGIVDMGLGTDTGGSVRIPAALNGIIGFRPSTGRYSAKGVTPLSSTRDIIGPLARSMSDIQKLDKVLACQSEDEDEATSEIKLSEVRLGIPRELLYANLNKETEASLKQALDKLVQAGVKLIEADISNVGELLQQSTFPIVLYEAKKELGEYLETYYPQLSFEDLVAQTQSPDVSGLFSSLLEQGVSAEDYKKALNAREELRAVYARYFSEHRLNAIVFPTTPLPAGPIIGSDETVELNGTRVPTFATYIQNSELATIVAAPALTLPIGVSDAGLPIGLEIDGLEGQDLALLKLGSKFEVLLR